MKHATDVTAMVNEKTAPRAAARREQELRRAALKMARIGICCGLLSGGSIVLYQLDLMHKYLALPLALAGLLCLTFTLGAAVQKFMPEGVRFRGRN